MEPIRRGHMTSTSFAQRLPVGPLRLRPQLLSFHLWGNGAEQRVTVSDRQKCES